MRGIPTILVVYLIGFGIPALALPGLPTDPVVLGGIALWLFLRYVSKGVEPERTAAPDTPDVPDLTLAY